MTGVRDLEATVREALHDLALLPAAIQWRWRERVLWPLLIRRYP